MWTGFSPCMPPHRPRPCHTRSRAPLRSVLEWICLKLQKMEVGELLRKYGWIFFLFKEVGEQIEAVSFMKVQQRGVSDIKGLAHSPPCHESESWGQGKHLWDPMGRDVSDTFVCEETDRFPIWLDVGEGSGFVTKCTDWKERGVHGSTPSMVEHEQWEQEAEAGFCVFSPPHRDQHVVSRLR